MTVAEWKRMRDGFAMQGPYHPGHRRARRVARCLIVTAFYIVCGLIGWSL